MSLDRRLIVDDIWNSMLSARAACAVKGPAWCYRELDRMEAAERLRRDALLHQAGTLGLTNDGEVIMLLEGGR